MTPSLAGPHWTAVGGERRRLRHWAACAPPPCRPVTTPLCREGWSGSNARCARHLRRQSRAAAGPASCLRRGPVAAMKANPPLSRPVSLPVQRVESLAIGSRRGEARRRPRLARLQATRHWPRRRGSSAVHPSAVHHTTNKSGHLQRSARCSGGTHTRRAKSRATSGWCQAVARAPPSAAAEPPPTRAAARATTTRTRRRHSWRRCRRRRRRRRCPPPSLATTWARMRAWRPRGGAAALAVESLAAATAPPPGMATRACCIGLP
jgi:hypothetical protein